MAVLAPMPSASDAIAEWNSQALDLFDYPHYKRRQKRRLFLHIYLYLHGFFLGCASNFTLNPKILKNDFS